MSECCHGISADDCVVCCQEKGPAVLQVKLSEALMAIETVVLEKAVVEAELASVKGELAALFARYTVRDASAREEQRVGSGQHVAETTRLKESAAAHVPVDGGAAQKCSWRFREYDADGARWFGTGCGCLERQTTGCYCQCCGKMITTKDRLRD